jgi:hypothetical protein
VLAAVAAAEAILGAGTRPVYCFVGCLHPGLGTVGMIFDRACCDDGLQGVSRCDSGGLAGGIGVFAYVPEDDRGNSLIEMSFMGDRLASWPDEFDEELASSYTAPAEYARGTLPNTDGWGDVRARCLESHSQAIEQGLPDVPPSDRRVWTWEARLNEGPEPHRLRFLVLSEAQRNSLTLDQLRDLGDMPDHVRVIVGRSTADGTEELFANAEVAIALVCT